MSGGITITIPDDQNVSVTTEDGQSVSVEVSSAPLEAELEAIVIQGPIGFTGPMGPVGPKGEDLMAPDLQDLTLLFENKLV